MEAPVSASPAPKTLPKPARVEQYEPNKAAPDLSEVATRLDVEIRCCGCCGVHPATKKQFWFHHPEGSFRKVWDIMQSVLLIYIAITVPIRLGFDVENKLGTPSWWGELLIDIYFWTDIVINFRTGVHNKDGIVVYDFKVIRNSYLCGWFVIDVVSCFPAGYIAEILSAGGGEGNCPKSTVLPRRQSFASVLLPLHLREREREREQSASNLRAAS